MASTTIVTHLPEGMSGRLIQHQELGTYTLEWSVQLRASEGDWLLSTFMPDRADSPDWEEGSFENAEAF
jgi:hypothetical protein